MQVLHHIGHHRYKITVFRSGTRFIVKFDDTDHDFAIKFREGEVNNVQEVIRQVDSELLQQIDAIFSDLSTFRMARFKKSSTQYPDII